MATKSIKVDCVIFGGGVSGLFILDQCLESGYSSILLEPNALGTGQTISSQGILHGGLKYEIEKKLNDSALNLQEMPNMWRNALAGNGPLDLSMVNLRADYCHLWGTNKFSSKIGLTGARLALNIKPKSLSREDYPRWFSGPSGHVARLDEQVIEPSSLIGVLNKKHSSHVLKTEVNNTKVQNLNGQLKVETLNPITNEKLNLQPTQIILAAGSGNATLRKMLNLQSGKTQERPLHMILVRGKLPKINGHCIDGHKPRVTITTTIDKAGRTVWQLGGQIAEDGIHMSNHELICHAIAEIKKVLPDVDISDTELSTYQAYRAEKANRQKRPKDISVLQDDAILTCWPTKLVLAPKLAAKVVNLLAPPKYSIKQDIVKLRWPKPTIALPPWEIDAPWHKKSIISNER